MSWVGLFFKSHLHNIFKDMKFCVVVFIFNFIEHILIEVSFRMLLALECC